LELALILVDDNSAGNPDRQIGVTRDASGVAGKTPGANHTTAEGRKVLFATSFPLAWGKASVRPDALMTGVAKVSEDLKRLSIVIYCYLPDKDPEKVLTFTATNGPETLVASGESFLTRGAFDNGNIEPQKVVQQAAKIRAKEEPYPLAAEAAAPIALEVRYDGQPTALQINNGKGFVSEPQEGQKVTFVLARKGDSTVKLGVVLKVNGENTLGKQRLSDAQCRKWILDPGAGPVTIEGFQVDGDTAKEFRVLSRAQSREREFYYGPDVGTVTVTVFREDKQKKSQPSKELLSDEAEDLAALNRGVYPSDPAGSLAALKSQLRLGSKTRGLIEDGKAIESRVEKVTFDFDPTPVMAATITYYRPQR
jgi:hypothetical protein